MRAAPPKRPDRIVGRSPKAAPITLAAMSSVANPATASATIQPTIQSAPTADLSSAPIDRSAPARACGSGRSRIARTMLRFAMRNEENVTVAKVRTTPRL